MDTASFLQKILPTRGIRFLAEWVNKPAHPKGGYFVHHPYGEDSDDTMAAKANQLSAVGGNVYFACASFREVIYNVSPGGHEYPAGRTQDNVKFVKALWLDMDVGKADPNVCYPTQREAAMDVMRLVREVGLPDPMLVSSGAGLHVYWPLTEQVEGDRWTGVAQQLKSICAHLKVKADPSRTADAASVLRPVGTKNPKHGKAVRVMRDAAAVPIGDIAAKLADFILAHHVSHTRRDNKPSLNAALIGEPIEYPPSHAPEIANRCAVMANFRDKMGNVNEPFWYAALGVLKHCVDGDTIAHAWSEGHPDYSRTATQLKLDQWSAGPTLCSKLEHESNLGVCKECPHHGKTKSPVQLGHVSSPAGTLTVEREVVIDGKVEVVTEDYHKPDGYNWFGGSMQRFVTPPGETDGDWIPFSDTLFYPISRVRDEEGTWNLRIRMSMAGHYWREFDLPQMLIPDSRGLSRHLAKYEIIIFGINHAMDYLKAYATWMREQNVEVTTYARFGWDEGRFIVGTTAFLPNGVTEPVLVTDNVINSGKAFDSTPKGDIAEWTSLLDQAYNRPGAEKYQFVIAAAFAAPLVPLLDFQNFRGIPIVLSGEGGSGKSSVCEAAATIYGDPKALMVNAGSEGGSTLNSLFALASMYNGVPLLFDEITERESKDFVPLMYTLSNGICKSRMTANGQFAQTSPPFAGIYYGTANVNVTDMLYDAAKKDVSDATSARCFEIGGLTKAEMLATFAGTNMKDLLEHKLFRHRGVAAQVYLPYIITHMDTISQQVESLRSKLGDGIDSDSRERFYIDTIAFTHVAATIAKKLGLIKWDTVAMTKWAMAHIKSLRRTFIERTALTEDNVALFLSWLHGRTIVTRNFPKGRAKTEDFETVNDTLRHAPCARVATRDKVMLVTVTAITEWCKEYNQVPEKFKEQLRAGNYILAERLEYLGKGTNVVAGRSRCIELNFNKVVGMTSIVTDGNVASIQREGVGA